VESVDAVGLLQKLTNEVPEEIEALLAEGRRACGLVLGLKHAIERRNRNEGSSR
jgi:hypothetical protein